MEGIILDDSTVRLLVSKGLNPIQCLIWSDGIRHFCLLVLCFDSLPNVFSRAFDVCGAATLFWNHMNKAVYTVRVTDFMVFW